MGGRLLPAAYRAALFVALLLTTRTVAAADVTVRATLNPPRAQVGESLNLSIEVNGAQNVAAPDLGEIKGFEVRYRGPSTQVSIVNGQMNAAVHHIYQLQAQQPGHFTIGPFTVEVSGQQYRTAPIAVDISPAGQAPGGGPGGAQLRVAMTVARNEIYLRERIPLDVTLYVGQVRAGDLQYPSIAGEGFSIDKFGEPTQRQETIDGQTYQVVRFQTMLTPLRTGTLNLGPATLQLNVYERRRGGIFDDPFFSDRRPTSLRSEPVTLTVLPLPEEGKPASFAGAVGRFTMDVSASPTELNAGDPITVRMTVSGSGNLGDVQAPSLSSTKGFRTYEPRPANSDETTRVFEQVLIPNDASITTLPPVRFSYFDSEQHQYRTIDSAPIPLVVHPAQQSQKAEIITGGSVQRPAQQEELGRDIVFIKDTPGTLTAPGSGMGLLFWLWQPLPLALAVAALYYDRQRTRLSGDVRYARFTRAGKAAQVGLRQATEAMQRNDRPAFYDCLAQTLRDYLAAKLDLPPGGVDVESVERCGVPSDVATTIRSLFETCELARFAPNASDGDMRTALGQVEEIVKRLERERRRGRRTAVALALLCSVYGMPFAHAAEPAAASSPQTTFFHANTLYGEGKYVDAVAAYEQVLANGVESGPLYFNLGNAYFKGGERGKAILNYERALRALPGDPDIQANLAYARSLTGAEPCEPAVWTRILFPLAARLTSESLAWLLSAIYSLGLGAFALFRVLPQHPRWLAQLSAACAVAGVVATASLVYQAAALNPRTEAVLIASSDTPARFQPAASGTEHFVLKVGALLRIIDEREGWAQVERCDGRRGWVPAAALALVSRG